MRRQAFYVGGHPVETASSRLKPPRRYVAVRGKAAIIVTIRITNIYTYIYIYRRRCRRRYDPKNSESFDYRRCIT